VAEQRDDGTPGTGIEPAKTGEPAPRLDPQQLREFEQFKQFQEFLRFTQAQQGNQPAPPPDAGLVTTTAREPTRRELPGPPRRKAPRWLTWIGKKVLGWIIAIVLLAIAGTIAYNHFFPSDAGKSSEEVAKEGGGRYHTNHIFSKNPYEAVRFVYQDIAQGSFEDACGRFQYDPTKNIDIQSKFAADLGQSDCRAAVQAINAQVTNKNSYAESLPSYISEPLTGDVVTIDSCTFPIQGGPALGVFTVTKVELGQWLITGHTAGPAKCPPLPPTPTS